MNRSNKPLNKFHVLSSMFLLHQKVFFWPNVFPSPNWCVYSLLHNENHLTTNLKPYIFFLQAGLFGILAFPFTGFLGNATKTPVKGGDWKPAGESKSRQVLMLHWRKIKQRCFVPGLDFWNGNFMLAAEQPWKGWCIGLHQENEFLQSVSSFL